MSPWVQASEEGYLLMQLPSSASYSKSGKGPVEVQAKITVDAPPEFVWQVLTDFERMDNILPGYEKCDVLQTSGASKKLDVIMKINRLLPAYKYQVATQENRNQRLVTFNRVSGDFKHLQAIYKLDPVNNGKQTVLNYRLSLDTGKTIPGTKSLVENNTEKTLKAFRGYVNQEFKKSMLSRR